MSAGRPSKYKPEYCEMLIEHMADGYTFESFAGVIGVCRDTLFEWVKTHRAFSDSKRVATAKQLLANEKLLKDIAKGKIRNANVTAQIFIMKNCHNWKDRIEQTNVDVTKEETNKLKQEAAELMKELE